ncbi:hypothetical protein RRG08_050222 [Elysia crispata]|uniref:6-phosphofructokinase n=1 Tax=Elysia crispata TaxID=231223 RepID=A0AAE1DBZ3_9GAST|nr:hypothetical protein RRG08_050222 [Elysia crispata]
MSEVEDRYMRMRHSSVMYKKPKRDSWSGTKVGLITAGDDAQGVNAALRAAVRMSQFFGCTVIYIKQGFKGLVEGQAENFVEATWISTSDVLSTAGTYIKSFKSDKFRERSGRLLAAKHLVEHGISNLVVIGGDGTLRGCDLLDKEWTSLLRELDDRNMVDRDLLREHRHLKIICIPCTITNDLCGTDTSIGVDSALARIIEATDNIATTSSSNSMAFVVEVMGGHSGYLALEAGIICDASMIFIPEYPPQGDWKEELHAKVRDDLLAGSEVIMCIVSEGATDTSGHPITPQCVTDVLDKKLSLNTKITVLGHFQRGGVPTAYDRLLATRFGCEAVIALKSMPVNTGACTVTIYENEIICIPVKECLEATDKCLKCMKDKNFAEAVILKGRRFQHLLSSYNVLHNMRSSPVPDMTGLPGTSVIGIMRVGKTSVAQCWVLKAIVGFCQSKYFCPLVIRDGFEGLVKGHYEGMTWDMVKEFTTKSNACLGSSSLTASKVGLQKIAAALGKLELSGLILLGGFPAFESLMEIDDAKHHCPALRIPMCLLPMTILNNIPGTDVALGSDTALNEIMTYCDKMKRAARGYQNCVFVVETTGHKCGYLASISGMVCGADAAYIRQEPFNLETLLRDATHLRDKIKAGVKLGLILRSEMANENYTTDFIHRVFSEAGLGVFSCRASTIGHIQIGGLPSALDRSMAINNGFSVASWMIETIESMVANSSENYTHVRLYKTVLSISGSSMVFEPISKLVAETNFDECLPLYMWWMKLRPLISILSGANEEKRHDGSYSSSISSGQPNSVHKEDPEEGQLGQRRHTIFV